MDQKRYPILDLVKAIAILLMFFFHFSYDLTLFGLAQIDFFTNPFWFYLPRFIVSCFLISSGASLVFAHQKQFSKKHFLKRSLKLLILALGISLVTFFTYRDRWIFMGTLHCLFITGLLGILFIKKPHMSLILSLVCLALVLLGYDTTYISRFLGTKSLDFIPPYPWMGMVWLGIYLGHTSIFTKELKQNRITKFIQLLSKHSLKIYLLHQPLFFALIFIYKKVFLGA